MPQRSDFEGSLERAQLYSPFLTSAMARHPRLVALLIDGQIDAALVAVSEQSQCGVRQRLRVERDALALVLAIGDLAGALPLEMVVQTLSAFADRALDAAIAEAIAMRVPGADSRGFTAIALGKHGSRELNYSSDIDPILIYDPRLLAVRARDDPAEAAVRVARNVVDLLQTRDGDGYVFRVDLRLRPAPEATPLALPVDAALSHYESSALAWERAAFIRARAAAGDLDLGRDFLDAIGSFVWRRSLDFGAIGELRAMSRRIREHHAAGQAFGPGFDLKRGRGGIREIEFFVQIQQLIHGGRNPALRVPDTLSAIAALANAALIEPAAADMLATAYRLFRTIEHRLQMIDDRQTHSLPSGTALDGVARLHGLSDGAALLELLGPHVDAVGALYDGLDSADDRPAPVIAADYAAFADQGALHRRLAEWRSGKLRALRNAVALEAMETALPQLMGSIASAPDPDAALAAFDRMLAGLPSALNLFRLLSARPTLQTLLVNVLSHAPTLARALGRSPALLDRLIDASALDPVGDVESLVAEMTRGPDIEVQHDRVRHIVGEHRFALGTQIVEGTSDPLDVAAGYARIAEAAVTVIANAVVDDFAIKHGRVPGSELVILALGRLGGGRLTHASDLDLIYLFTGDFRAESDGERPLGASHYYNRLAQRLSAGLSAPTSVGPLYEIDTRLRPSGTQGPLVVSVESFERYQRESAWTWEHMALTRARTVYGSADARIAVDALIADVLAQPRDRAIVRRDVVKMRADIAQNKRPLGVLDVKLGDGGLVDLEFAVQFEQLASGRGLTPDLGAATEALFPSLRGAHDFLTRLLVTLRLVSPDMAVPCPVTQPVVARACGVADWSEVLVLHDAARQSVAAQWARVKAGAK